ncbi:IS630 family transposase [Streptomyces sp. NPDC048430]|uniref:IS630 family transposase n=1 Tax=Streptomyces sp. NPDC048430 TaxID=3155388 RepID=UPI003424A95A
MRSDRVTGRTWGVKGRTPVVRRTGNRFSVNPMSAISTKGRMHFMVFTESFDATVMCRFLAGIVGHFDRKHLIVDRHSAHRSKTVRAWLADHEDEIELHFLPSYSPGLNPDELVNADLKRSLPHTHRARNRTELAAETRRFFHRRKRQPMSLPATSKPDTSATPSTSEPNELLISRPTAPPRPTRQQTPKAPPAEQPLRFSQIPVASCRKSRISDLQGQNTFTYPA